jgi:hypothetical protein
MSSGGKQLVYSTLERAISADQNRAQLFAACDRGELFRYLMDTPRGADDLSASAAATQVASLTSPITAEVMGGLMVRPQLTADGATGLDVFVDPGIAWMINPDGDPDSSNYKFVRDPGVSGLPSALQMTTNSSGSTRIDVVECAYVLNTPETDNRDIWNPATNTFAAAAISKATQAGLVYRVRTGTPGSGFPGTASGWLPLAVASVPNGTTGNDTITFWDVRPLVSDRVVSPGNISFEMAHWHPSSSMTVQVRGAQSILTGFFETTATDIVTPAYGVYRLGGRMRRGTPGTDIPLALFDGLDLAAAANQDGTVAPGVNYLYVCEPLGLPRWARYTDATTGARVPRSPRGMLVLSNTVPNHLYGTPHTAIALPASTGLGGTTNKATAILAVGTLSSGSSQPAGAMLTGRYACIANGAYGSFNTGISTAAFTTSVASFILSEGTNFPSYARGVWVTFVLTMTGSGTFGISSADLSDGTNVIGSVARGLSGGPQSNTPSVQFYVPLFAEYAQGEQGSVIGRTLIVNYAAITGGPAVGASLQISGWDCY